MIGFFPDPYPDELLYSVCARYHHRAGYSAHNPTARDLFDTRFGASIGLPGSLNHLITALPPGHCYSVDQLIDQHTLLPFYAPFLPPERVSRIRSSMAEEKRGHVVYWQAGTIMRSKIHLECLRYCPDCVSEDRRRYGEAYWRRVHQAPGVLVCPHHAVLLKPSNLYTYNRGHRKFWKIDQVMKDSHTPLQKVGERDHQMFLWIAQEVWWLLNHHPSPNSSEELRGRYHSLLFSRSLASYTGIVRIRELQDEFLNFYSEELLKELHCQLDGSENWLVRLAQARPWAQHPIRHLLLMCFLGCSTAEFFQLTMRPQPFGAGPWPCMNPICEHYQEPSIEKFKISRLQVGHKSKREKAADFRCVCGFTYSRPFPDSTSVSATDSYRVKSCGAIWDETMHQLYLSGMYTSRELAKKLGVTLYMIRSKIKRLKQGQQALDNHESAKQALAKIRGEAQRIALESKRAMYREQWLQVMKENPIVSRSHLGNLKPSAYNWLKRHDREWFETVSPPFCTNPNPSFVDWKQRDGELASAVRAAAERLKQSTGLPLRVSKHAIAQEIGKAAIISRRAYDLPETIAVLEEVSEGPDELAVRRIQWATESLREENHPPIDYREILARASVKWRVVKRAPIVKAAILAAAREFGISDGKLDDPE